MKSHVIKGALAAALATCHWSAQAEDIDLFVGTPVSEADLPNVLFVVDNTANWTEAFEVERSALEETLRNLPTNEDGTARFNVGVMFSAETSSSDSNVSGGYVRAALRPMTSQTKELYADMIAALDKDADKGNGGASSLMIAEAYLYLSGGTPHAGNNKAKADYLGNTGADWADGATTQASLDAMKAIYLLEGNALSAKGATTYNTPVGTGCGKNYIIYISNGASQDNNSTNSTSTTLLADAGGDTSLIPLSPSGSQNNVLDEWGRFLNEHDTLDVTIYAIDVNPKPSGQGPGWAALLKSLSGDDNYTPVSTTGTGTTINEAINKALSEIQAVNSVFASVSLPLGASPQDRFQNQVFIGMFRPDGRAMPRWMGNLKQYQIGALSGALRLADADGKDAINSLTGGITECARSFWTPDEPDDYWSFSPAGECIPPASYANQDTYRISNFPDGSIVEKGGQGYMLRDGTPASRDMTTCSPTSCTALTAFSTGNTAITQALLGAASTTDRTELINWARGEDVYNEDSDTTTTMRPSSHADVAHSRPVAVDFGIPGAPEVVVFYGGNDGVLRAINGNQTASITSTIRGSVPVGEELWSFMPPEFYGSIKRLRDNNVPIDFPNITAATAEPKPYGIDGPITFHQNSTETWLYAAMRRGGRSLYAFSVNNDDPADISLKWKIGCPENFPQTGTVSDSGCTTDFEGIGQTWSPAKPFYAAGYSSGSSPLLIMGGGYDTCEDGDPHTCTSATKGNKIYVLDANTGTRLNTLDTDRSVVADVVIVPDSSTGFAKYAYTADLGGNVYRIDIGTDLPQNWTITKIASLGCDTIASCTANRKFLFAPDILEINGEYVLLLGSGDREKPLLYYNDAASVSNYFFMLRDRPADSNWLGDETTTCGAAVLCIDSLLGIATSADPSAADLALKKGWYLVLDSTEQVVTSALTIFGTVTFSTHTPDVPQPGMCTARLGTARVYNISYANAASTNGTQDRSQELPADTGLPPSPVAGMVEIDGQLLAFCFGCSDESSIQAEEPPIPPMVLPSQPKGRVYWYVER